MDPAASLGPGVDEEEDAAPDAGEGVAPGLLARGRAVARDRGRGREDPRVRAVVCDRGEVVVGPTASPGPDADEEEDAAPGAGEDVASGLLGVHGREDPRVRASDTGNVGEAVVGPGASPGPGADEEEEDVAPGAVENPHVRAVDEEPESDGVPEISTNDCRHSSGGGDL